MIKECPVIINNDAVTVVKFGDTDIQFPSIAKDIKKVNVKYDNGKYSIVDHAEEEKPVIAEHKETETAKVNSKRTKKTIEKKHDDVVEK